MGKEIERKYLVTDESYIGMSCQSHRIVQGYISRRKDGTVRVRVRDNEAFLTIKSATVGISRHEWEYPIPVTDAEEMLAKVCEGIVIDKQRYIVDYKGFRWEIDRFGGTLEGLVLAEVELPTADTEAPLPPFIGREVSHDPRYFNSNLSDYNADSHQ